MKISHFVLGGGSTLHFADHLISDRGGIQSQARKLGLGISAGPFENPDTESLVADYLSSFERVVFRDDRSHQWASSIGLGDISHRGFDMALLADDAGLLSTPKQALARWLGISMLSPQQIVNLKDDRINYPKLLNSITTSLSKPEFGHPTKVLNLCANPDYSDADAGERIVSNLRSHEIKVYSHTGDVRKTIEEMNQCSHIISMRLHGCVVALALGIPFIVLSYHQKCIDFANTIGLDRRLVIPLSEFESGRFEEGLQFLFSLKQPPVKVSKNELKRRAALNFPEHV